MRRLLPVAAALALVAGAAACATGGVRPRDPAFPAATMIEVESTHPSEVIARLEDAVRKAGLRVARYAPLEGYLETRWFDATTRAVAEAPWSHLDRIVRIRIYADPDQGKTRVLAECVQRFAYDPSLPDRDVERVVAADHPGSVLLDSLLAPLRPDTAAGRRPPLDSRP